MKSPAEQNALLTLPPGTLANLLTSLKQQWKRSRKGLKRCENKASQKAVHAARVDTRRLLSLAEETLRHA